MGGGYFGGIYFGQYAPLSGSPAVIDAPVSGGGIGGIWVAPLPIGQSISTPASEEMDIAMAVDVAQYKALQQQVDEAIAQGGVVADLVQKMLANGLQSFISGHGLMEFGDGVMRLDDTGLQIHLEAAGTSYNVMYLVPSFQSSPSTFNGPIGVIGGRTGTGYMSVDIQAIGARTGSKQATLQLFRDTADDIGWVAVGAGLFRLSDWSGADPTTVITNQGIAGDAMIYRTDTSKFRGYDGAWKNFAMEDWVTANALATTRGNWKVFYSNGTGVFTELVLGAAGTFLQSNGATSAPTFVAALPAARGNWKVFYSNGTGVFTELALGAAGTFLRSVGTTSAPAFNLPVTASALLSADKSTTSATFVDVDATNAAVTLTPTSGRVLVGWSGPMKANGNACLLTLNLDGADGNVLSASGVGFDAVSGDRQASFTALYTGLSVASHTWKLRFRNNDGATSVSINGGTKINGAMWAAEV